MSSRGALDQMRAACQRVDELVPIESLALARDETRAALARLREIGDSHQPHFLAAVAGLEAILVDLDAARVDCLAATADALPIERLSAAHRDVNEANGDFERATGPSQNPDVIATVERLRRASTAIAGALAQAHQVVTHLVAFANLIGVAPIERAARPLSQSLRPSPVEGADPIGDRRAVVSSWVAELARRPPRRTKDHDRTEGFLLFGAEVCHDPTFSAEADGRMRSRRLHNGERPIAGIGLRPPVSHATIMDHVEAQAAAVIRNGVHPGSVTLVIQPDTVQGSCQAAGVRTRSRQDHPRGGDTVRIRHRWR